MVKRLGILTSGGDCPGLNAAIRAVVRRATTGFGMEVVGIEDGVAGFVEGRSRQLTPERFDLGGLDPMLSTGGTILGSLNKSIGEVEDQIAAGYRSMGLDALVAIGGDGSLAILDEKARRWGWNLVGIPKTIDNDVALTDRCIGFDSAVHTVVEALKKLRTTGVSHDRVMILETMGRDAGHLALHSGIAGGADAILIPEIPWSADALYRAVEATRGRRTNAFALVVVAEGAGAPGGEQVAFTDSAGRRRLGGIGETVARTLETESGGRIEARTTVLGHLQRGGSPSPIDSILATSFGVGAVDLVAAGRFGRMVAIRGTRIGSVPLEEVTVLGARPVDPAGQLVADARAMGVYAGDES